MSDAVMLWMIWHGMIDTLGYGSMGMDAREFGASQVKQMY